MAASETPLIDWTLNSHLVLVCKRLSAILRHYSKYLAGVGILAWRLDENSIRGFTLQGAAMHFLEVRCG